MLVALGVVLWAGAASAVTVSYVWTATSGSAVGVGSNTLTGLEVNDTATLDVLVTADGGTLTTATVSAMWDNSVLNIVTPLTGACPAGTGNLAPGLCGGVGTLPANTFLTPLGTPNYPANPPNTPDTAGSWSGDGFTGLTSGTFTVARISFTAVGPGTSNAALFRTGIDGVIVDGVNRVPGDSGFTLFDATAVVVPEPGTLALLGLGLGALALVGRRR